MDVGGRTWNPPSDEQQQVGLHTVAAVWYQLISMGLPVDLQVFHAVPLVLDVMDEVLLADRFARAIAAAPAVSCPVPLPPTMPKVKISKNGLPMPVRLESEAPLFHNLRRPNSTKRVPVSATAESKYGNWDMEEAQAKEIEELSSAIRELRIEYNRHRQIAAAREERLETLQVAAFHADRDGLDADDEMAYMRALREASEGELVRVAEMMEESVDETERRDFMRRRMVLQVAESKHLVATLKPQVNEIDRKLASATSRATELQNSSVDVARSLGLLQEATVKTRERAHAQLKVARVQAAEAEAMLAWTAQQVKDSYKRVKEAEHKKTVVAAQAERLSPAEQLQRFQATAREQKLEKGMEKLRRALGW